MADSFENSEDDDMICTPPDIIKEARNAEAHSLPQKYQKKYEKTYKTFQD